MAYNENLCSYQFTRDWDFQNFGVLNEDISFDSLSLDLSTGYLEDAVDDWINRCKRRRMSSDDSLEQVAELSKKNNDGLKKVAYPFEMVKPGGLKGEVTLNEINERIMMRPTRTIRHPVGDLACNPRVLARGFGPSGKAVVAVTRIHTQGRGTVTIIKTRG
ncbi:hypothetical protein IFM89_003000 [Coptis chinensis]|uniref:Uncharacterized protein n=1 Tax=Coptis chinensis TaxID=261450 RepID=A0A835ISP7_9MAGN|nr:hypothetical protein IFM89_003000 [Coptis chinensis]